MSFLNKIKFVGVGVSLFAGAVLAQQVPVFQNNPSLRSFPGGGFLGADITNSAPVASSNKSVLSVIQGVDFSTSKAIDDRRRLLEDADYFIQLCFDWQDPFGPQWFDLGFSLDFRNTYFEANAPTAGILTLSDVKEARGIGMTISPKISFPSVPVVLRCDIGGVMAQSDKDGVDEAFNAECAVVLGLETSHGENGCFRSEAGVAFYERLPDDEVRSLVRFLYSYGLKGGNLLFSVEFSGMEHEGSEEARVQIGYQLDPIKFFEVVGTAFMGE